MSDYQQQRFGPGGLPAVDVGSRATFLVRTYNHLFGAILAFTLIEFLLFQSGAAEQIVRWMTGVSWLLVLGAFMVVGWLARGAAHRSTSLGTQYLALGGYVLAQALIFVPLLYIAEAQAPGAIESAGAITLIGFAALTGVAFWTRKDFSFLGGLLRWGGILALVAIVGAILFSFPLGVWFSFGMVALAGAAILYDTSNVIHRSREDRYVAAALELFASVALMFWYVLRIFMSRD